MCTLSSGVLNLSLLLFAYLMMSCWVVIESGWSWARFLLLSMLPPLIVLLVVASLSLVS